jgi:exopolyphosphatase/pppGpp-phosphohydrolase
MPAWVRVFWASPSALPGWSHAEERTLARYKHLSVKKVDMAELAPKPKERKLSPRQIATMERDDEIRAALNEAASLPASQAVVIDLKEGQKLPTMRAAFNRVLKTEPREINWGVRGNSIVISKGQIPGRGGPRR